MMKNRRVRDFFLRLKEDPFGILAVILLFLIVFSAIFAPLSPYDPNKTDITMMLSKPTLTHPFGTDDLGRDYLTRALYGARVSLIVGITAMGLSSGIGLIVGVISGYFGGIIGDILMRVVDVLTAIPWMILVTVISLFLKPGLFAIIIVIGFFTWMKIARLVRAETLRLKEREYVLYAKASGQSDIKILFKHILPGIYPIFIVSATIGIASAIMTESALSFLGLGVKAPLSSWGSMLQTAQNNLSTAPYMAFLPGFLIFITIYSLNKLGDLLRGVMEPKTGIKE